MRVDTHALAAQLATPEIRRLAPDDRGPADPDVTRLATALFPGWTPEGPPPGVL